MGISHGFRTARVPLSILLSDYAVRAGLRPDSYAACNIWRPGSVRGIDYFKKQNTKTHIVSIGSTSNSVRKCFKQYLVVINLNFKL